MLTIRPWVYFFKWGIALRHSQTALIVVRWNAFSQASSSTWSSVPGGAPGVHDQNVEAPHRLDRGGHQRLDLLPLGDVCHPVAGAAEPLVEVDQ